MNDTPQTARLSPDASSGVALSMLEHALRYAAKFGPVHPLHSTRAGVCDCPKRAECQHPGKHPRTEHGADDATRDPVQIRRWWTIWPNANIGLALKRAGLIDVAPDSERWLKKFQRNGLPRTPSYESGGGAGHEHYLFMNPDDWATTRVCKPGEYDILSDGYAVLPPSTNGSGPYVWLTGPDQVDQIPVAPLWVKDYLPQPKPPRANLPLGGDDADEPPVRMAGRALQRYQGEQAAFKASDRSGWLYAIANDLARGNASMRTIVDALADRDIGLGLNKFSDRSDAQERYAEMALKALANTDDDPTEEQDAPWSEDDDGPPPKLCNKRCPAQQQLEVIDDILANPHHARASAKVGMVAMVRHHGWAFQRSPKVERRLSLTALSKATGLTNSTLSSNLRLYDGKPGAPLQWRQDEPEKGNYAKPTFVTLRANSLTEFGKMAREFDPEVRKWGGDRTPEPAPPCEHDQPAVAEVTERQERKHLVAADGCEYLHSRWLPGRTATRAIEVDESIAVMEHPPGSEPIDLNDGTTIYGQVAPRPMGERSPEDDGSVQSGRLLSIYDKVSAS